MFVTPLLLLVDLMQVLSLFFVWGAITFLESEYPKYYVSKEQNFDFAELIFNPASRNLISTSLSFSRWSKNVLLDRTNKSSKYVFKYS